jgi:hypothetical protein
MPPTRLSARRLPILSYDQSRLPQGPLAEIGKYWGGWKPKVRSEKVGSVPEPAAKLAPDALAGGGLEGSESGPIAVERAKSAEVVKDHLLGGKPVEALLVDTFPDLVNSITEDDEAFDEIFGQSALRGTA